MRKGFWLALCVLCLGLATPSAALMCAASTWGEEAKIPFTIDKDRQETESGIGIFIDHRFFIIKPFKGVTAGQEITLDCRIGCFDTSTTGELALYGRVPRKETIEEIRAKAIETCKSFATSDTEYAKALRENCVPNMIENKTMWCDFRFLKLGQPQGKPKPNNIAAASTFVDFDIAAWMQTLPQDPRAVLSLVRKPPVKAE